MEPKDRGKNQADKFREAARELETDDSEERFDATLKKVATSSPRSSEKEKPAKK